MKRFILGAIIVLAFIAGCNEAKASNPPVNREGKTFVQTSSRGGSANSDIPTEYKWKDKSGNEYPIYLHQYTKGEKQGQWGAYVIKKSAKSGKEYKYYFPNNAEIAKQIQEETK